VETRGPFVRFLALPGGQEPEAIFGFSLPFLPDMSTSPWLSGTTPRERLQESLRLQVRLVDAFWSSGITALDLRFIGIETSPGVVIGLLCRLRRPVHIQPMHFRDHCLAVAQYVRQLFADTGFELVSLEDEASLTRYLSPFRLQAVGEIRKKEEIVVIQDVYVENEVYATYPWQWTIQNRLRLLEVLLRRQSNCLISVYLEPTQLSPQEQNHLSHATSLRVRKLLWSAGAQGEAIYNLYAAYAQNLRRPYLIRITLGAAHSQTVGQIGRVFIDELSAVQNPGIQPVLLFPQNQQEWQAVCQSTWYVTNCPWGASHGRDLPGTARLRLLVDAETASMAFRIPVTTSADTSGIPVRTHSPSLSNPLAPSASTLAGSTASKAPTEPNYPVTTALDISKMRSLEDLVGQALGNCQIEALLGKGGFGAVYRARQRGLGRVVAVKIILPILTPANAEEEQLKWRKMLLRFDREAQALARLDHPHILPLYEYQQSPLPYLVMPYMVGGSLADEMQASGHRLMPIDGVAAILSQVASALDHAHQQQLVHRDLKPHNLLRHADGRVLLSDFGIVQFEDADLTALTAGQHSPYTQSYASPEQHQNMPVDYRTDIYSLGVTIYELLCGQRPFKTPYEHVFAPPPAFHPFGIKIPDALEAVVHKALAKRAEDRYQSATAFASAFQAALPSK
jgi:Protein kinase domain